MQPEKLTQEERVAAMKAVENFEATIAPHVGTSPRLLGLLRRALVDLEAVERQRNELRKALVGLIEGVVFDSKQKGISGFTGARLYDARAALSGAVEAPPAGEGAVAPCE